MGCCENEEGGIEKSEEDDEGDVRLHAANENDEECKSPADEIDSESTIEAFTQQSFEIVASCRVRLDDSKSWNEQDSKTQPEDAHCTPDR